MNTFRRNRRFHVFSLGLLVLILASCGGGGSSSGGGGGGGGGAPPVVITTSTLPDGVTTVAYSASLSSTGGKAPIHWSVTGFFPAGLQLDSGTGVISGTVTNAVFGDVTFTATDSSSTPQIAHKTIRMTFNWKLSVFTTTLPAAHTSAAYDGIIQSDGYVSSSTWNVSSGSLPPGLQLTNPTGTQVEITGTPAQTGTYPFTIQVKDNANPPQVAQRDLTLTVDSALAITTARLSDGIQNQAYSSALGAVNGVTPYHWSATGLPPGVTINSSSGSLSGVPTMTGNYSVTITATDSSVPVNTASQNYVLSVVSPLSIFGSNLQPWPLPDAVNGQPYYYYFSAFGGSGSKVWSITSGTLPPGISIASQYGTLTGTPTQLGSYNFTIQVQDSGNPQQTAQSQVKLNVVPPALVIQGSIPQRMPLGVVFDGFVSARGGTPPYVYSQAGGTLPPGLNFDNATGELSGTPTTLGQYSFVIQVRDSGTPAQTTSSGFWTVVSQPLGRNDKPSNATPIGDAGATASISPYADPPDSPSPVPDSDFYKIVGNAGSTIKIDIVAKRVLTDDPLDSVLEITDANGVRLNTCRLPGDLTNNFNSNCLNDDIQLGVIQDSELEVKVPASAGTQSSIYAHVLDWRGDARPDMYYTINVTGSVAPLAIVENSLNACGLGITCSYQMQSTGGTGAITWAVSSGALPPGIQLSSTGLLSGTAQATGSFTFTVKVTDSATPAQTATRTFTQLITTPPTITTASLPDGTSGVPYSYTVTATGGTPPLNWGSNQSNTNFGLILNDAGVLAGTPRYPGTYPIGISITDYYGLWDSKSYTVTINPGPLSVSNVTYPAGKVGVYYQALGQIPTGGTPDFTFALASGSTLPPGLDMPASSGSLGGTPTTAGTYQYTVVVTDSGTPAQTARYTATITITN